MYFLTVFTMVFHISTGACTTGLRTFPEVFAACVPILPACVRTGFVACATHSAHF